MSELLQTKKLLQKLERSLLQYKKEKIYEVY